MVAGSAIAVAGLTAAGMLASEPKTALASNEHLTEPGFNAG